MAAGSFDAAGAVVAAADAPVERPDVGAARPGLGALVAAGAGVTLWETPEPQAASNTAIST